jgi:hypothetical protein
MRDDDVRELLASLGRIEHLLMRFHECKIPDEYQVELTMEEAADRFGCTVAELVEKMESGEVSWMPPVDSRS